jgi:hypothetical protein
LPIADNLGSGLLSVSEPSAEIDELFDELLPYFEKIDRYIGIVPQGDKL